MNKVFSFAFTIVLIAILLLGCGAKGQNKQADNRESEGNQPAAAEQTWPRTYVDALGHEVVLDKEPQKVVTLMHVLFPDILLALGKEPVGVAGADTMLNQWEAYRAYTKDKRIIDIGDYDTPNLEKLLELEPDLIIAASDYHADAYEQLKAIAPVVYLDYMKIGSDRNSGIREVAKILGKEEQGETVIANLETKIAAARDKLQTLVGENETVIFSTANSDGNFWLYNRNITPTNQEKGLGLKVPETYPEGEELVGLEGLSVLNPDYLFIFVDKSADTSSEEMLKNNTDNAVWNKINAIKNNRVFVVDRSWFAREAPIATDFGIDAILDIFAEANS